MSVSYESLKSLGIRQRKIIERGGHMAGWASALDEAVDRFQGFLFNPNLATLGADLGRNILKQIEMSVAPFLSVKLCGGLIFRDQVYSA